ncbi:hypothetical protein LSUE1_G006578 [Lachnellula suecica]|uniref:Aminoglycoside phosphotransferase domain-containing protein n=1 Tax=Lachnellula suecica TaxID=602035 RepID=A0A8T9BZL4_9HELO|nr:hypothetical protein LSUE1_G006578 [Lachnellula suecica]
MADYKCIECGFSGTIIETSVKTDVKRVRLPRKVIRDRREFDNTYHPGVESADLYHEVHGVPVGDRPPYPKPSDDEECNARRNPKVLCHNCGWTTANEACADGYTSRLKIAYVRGNNAFWDLGPNGPWILRDETNNSTNVWRTDYTVQQFIRARKPSIPLVEMHRFGGPEDKFHFTMMARAKGTTLDSVYDTLTREQLFDVLYDLKEHIKQLRQITSPQMQRVDGSELRDIVVGNCTGFGCVKTGHNEEDWLENLTPAMRKGFLYHLWRWNKGASADQATRDSWIKEIDEKVEQLKAKFPRGGPYVFFSEYKLVFLHFPEIVGQLYSYSGNTQKRYIDSEILTIRTHGDLHYGNIFVSNDNPEKKFKVSAIIDWELAGFFPWWVEGYRGQLNKRCREILGTDRIYYPGHTSKDFDDTTIPVEDVQKAWYAAGNHGMSMHGSGHANIWYRPPFCACQPFAHEIRDSALGWEQEHMDMFDIDSSDSEDLEYENAKKFSKDQRKFHRWFNQIQWPSQTATIE